jgi:hypothetical protein
VFEVDACHYTNLAKESVLSSGTCLYECTAKCFSYVNNAFFDSFNAVTSFLYGVYEFLASILIDTFSYIWSGLTSIYNFVFASIFEKIFEVI